MCLKTCAVPRGSRHEYDSRLSAQLSHHSASYSLSGQPGLIDVFDEDIQFIDNVIAQINAVKVRIFLCACDCMLSFLLRFAGRPSGQTAIAGGNHIAAEYYRECRFGIQAGQD